MSGRSRERKELRRYIEGQTAELPEREYQTLATRQVVLTPDCVRGVYKRAKQTIKAAKRGITKGIG